MVNGSNGEININKQPDVEDADINTAVFLLMMGVPFARIVIEQMDANEASDLSDTMRSIHKLSFTVFSIVSKSIEETAGWEVFLKERTLFQEWYFFFRSLRSEKDKATDAIFYEPRLPFNSGCTPEDVACLFDHVPPLLGAYYLSCLPTEIGFQILNKLEDKRIIAVSKELIQMNNLIDNISRPVQRCLDLNPEYLPAVHSRLNKRPYLIDYLNCCGFSSKEELIIDIIEEYAPETVSNTCEDIMVFEDLVHINADEFRLALAPFDLNEIAIALKTASESIKMKIQQSLSPDILSKLLRANEEIGLKKLSEVEAIQQAIVFSYRMTLGKPNIKLGWSRPFEHRDNDDVWV